jgi:hypothetical protein
VTSRHELPASADCPQPDLPNVIPLAATRRKRILSYRNNWFRRGFCAGAATCGDEVSFPQVAMAIELYNSAGIQVTPA